MTPTIPTFLLGLLMGYLGQRSRLCFVSGYRDYFLMRDTALLKGVLGALLGAFIGYLVLGKLGGEIPFFPLLLRSDSASAINWIRIVVGGVGMGLIGAIVGGCPFRMHVLAAEGKKTYWFYLLGFYGALVSFEAIPWKRAVDLLRN